VRGPPDDFDLEGARDLFWQFHWGRPPTRELRVRGPRNVPGAVAQLGTLVALELDGGRGVWPKRDTIHLATNRRGRELYLVAPDGIQCDEEVAWPRRIVAIRYRTNKGDGNEVWRHAFEGRRPLFQLDDEHWPEIVRAGSKFRVTWRGIVG
jgi:hypothetical protein